MDLSLSSYSLQDNLRELKQKREYFTSGFN